MTERELEKRLRETALSLDALAPSFDPALLRRRRPRLRWVLVIGTCAAVLAAVAAQPDAWSAVARFLGVTSVEELGAPDADVAPPFLGRAVSRDAASRYVEFSVREITALGEPERFYGRDDLAGGMVSVSYAGGIFLTQWSSEAVDASVEVVASRGVAEDVTIGSLPAVWIAGEARGTIAVVGADGARHREALAMGAGVLTWERAGVGFILRGAGSKAEAVRLAASVE